MVNGQSSTTHTVAPQGVVQDYLDVLLRHVLPDIVPEPVVPEPVVPEVVVPEVVVPEVVVPEIIAPGIDQISARAEPKTPAILQVREQKPWADKPFASLLFDVMGLKLAAPLHELGGIMPLADKLQPMAAQADWFMGLIRWNGRTIRVVDTARFVMPERIGPDQSTDYQSVVVLGDSHWALAVNNADQSVHLQPADVRWRKTTGKRPWLAGTVLDRLCALLDVDVLVAMLDASDTARQIKTDLARNS